MNMQISKTELTNLASRKLWHGEYVATDNFKAIEKHASVCFEDGALVAVTGRADDRESQLYAAMFADAPAMLLEVSRLREALEIAADALANEDLSQSEKMYESKRARAALKGEFNG